MAILTKFPGGRAIEAETPPSALVAATGWPTLIPLRPSPIPLRRGPSAGDGPLRH
jgi:hypothetical protein